MNPAVRRGRRTLLLLALVFLGPMAVAMGLYFTGFQWRPQGSTAHGMLYEPVRPLPGLTVARANDGERFTALRGKWTLLTIASGECAQVCRQSLVATRQVRRALGRDLDRVQRVHLSVTGTVDDRFFATEHPDLAIGTGAPVIAKMAEIVGIAGDMQDGDILLADPLGNLVMRYPAGTGMKDLFTDLQRLLKISTIG